MKKPLQGTVNLPGSKSESNRALMIAAFGGFPLEVDHLSEAHDTVLLKTLLEHIGATKQSPSVDVDCEDAGTVARFLLTYLANKPGTWRLTGTERLCQRPMKPLLDALRQLGANIVPTSVGGIPVIIHGQLILGGSVTLDGSQSSQFASSLLMAAPTWEKGLQLTLTGNLVSLPYLKMTLQMMAHFGVHVGRQGNTLMVGQQSYHPCPFKVSADWSAASYWYEMLALNEGGGDVLLKGLKAGTFQGDAIVADWFKPFGIVTSYEPQGVRLTKADVVLRPRHLVFDFTDTPDLFPAIYATCVALGVEAEFQGTSTLSGKESDRFDALKVELSRIQDVTVPVFRSYHDHRIAMSLASLWPLLGTIAVDDPSVVDKSYPGFWKELESIRRASTP